MAQIKNETEKRRQTADDNKEKEKKNKEKKKQNKPKPQTPTEFNPPERKPKGLTRLKLF